VGGGAEPEVDEGPVAGVDAVEGTVRRTTDKEQVADKGRATGLDGSLFLLRLLLMMMSVRTMRTTATSKAAAIVSGCYGCYAGPCYGSVI
jgi:hypothetical protein